MTTDRGGTGSTGLARAMLWLTLGWNVVEGGVGVAAGIAAGSIALAGFGLDSFIEVGAAGVMLWRLRLPAHDARAERRERIAGRLVGATFVLLAAYVVSESAYALVARHEPGTSPAGMALSLAALLVMPVLGIVKRRNAVRLGSNALVAESTETLLCSYLALTLFAGLVANAAFGWWWADVAAALAMVPWILREGVENLRIERDE